MCVLQCDLSSHIGMANASDYSHLMERIMGWNVSRYRSLFMWVSRYVNAIACAMYTSAIIIIIIRFVLARSALVAGVIIEARLHLLTKAHTTKYTRNTRMGLDGVRWCRLHSNQMASNKLHDGDGDGDDDDHGDDDGAMLTSSSVPSSASESFTSGGTTTTYPVYDKHIVCVCV